MYEGVTRKWAEGHSLDASQVDVLSGKRLGAHKAAVEDVHLRDGDFRRAAVNVSLLQLLLDSRGGA